MDWAKAESPRGGDGGAGLGVHPATGGGQAGQTTAYYCVGQTCRLPETNPEVLAEWLREDRGSEKSPATEAEIPSVPAPE